MPRIPYDRPIIQVDLSDRVFQNTRYKQRAQYRNMHLPQAANGEALVELIVSVVAYSDDNGRYGDVLTTRGIPEREFSLFADADTLVDAATGDILASLKGLDAVQREEVEAQFPQDTQLQIDHFLEMRDQGMIPFAALVRKHIIDADVLMKKFA